MSTDEEFSAFVAARADHLYRQAWLLTGTRQAAEDLVQTSLTKTYAAWSRVRRADDPVAYVHGVLMKTFLSDRRRRWSGEVPHGDLPDRPAPHDPMDIEVDRLALVGALAGLGRTDRAVVVLRYWDDRSVADTAQALGLSEAAVKNRSLRALRRLGDALSDVPETHPSPTTPEGASDERRSRDPGARRAAPRHRRPDRPGHQPDRDRGRARPQPPPSSARGRRGRHPLRGDPRRRTRRDRPRRLEPHHRSADRDRPDAHPERDAHARSPRRTSSTTTRGPRCRPPRWPPRSRAWRRPASD